MQELIMLVRKRRCLLIHFFKRFSGISLFLVAFLMSRFKIPFSLHLDIGINLIFLGTKSFFGFPIDAILKILVWFWKQYVRYGERFNLTLLVILVKFLFKILSDSDSSDTSLYFSIGISFEFNPLLLESSLLVFQNFLLLLINLHIVPLTIWYHLFLEFWLVDTWFFAHPQDQCAATCLKNVRQLNKGGAKSWVSNCHIHNLFNICTFKTWLFNFSRRLTKISLLLVNIPIFRRTNFLKNVISPWT